MVEEKVRYATIVLNVARHDMGILQYLHNYLSCKQRKIPRLLIVSRGCTNEKLRLNFKIIHPRSIYNTKIGNDK